MLEHDEEIMADTNLATSVVAGLSSLTVFIPLVTTGMSAVVSATVAGVICYVTHRSQGRKYLNEVIDKMLQIAVTYPYLEDDAFCQSWIGADKTDEKVQRYDNYCCFVFNVIAEIWDFCRGNEKKIDEVLWVGEMAIRHQSWWRSNPENRRAYAIGFQDYIDKLLKAEEA
jgi:hypothetical protein